MADRFFLPQPIGKWTNSFEKIKPSAEQISCQHTKVYSYSIITTSPAQKEWICSRCMLRSIDTIKNINRGPTYVELLKRWEEIHTEERDKQKSVEAPNATE